jgi:hypothetical protein
VPQLRNARVPYLVRILRELVDVICRPELTVGRVSG